MADDRTTEQTPPRSEDTGVKRLYRSIHQKILGGVCGGIAEYLNVDVVIIRIAWVLFTLMGGTGLLAYLICWLIIPAQTDPSFPVPPSRGSGGMILGLILIGLGLILLFSWFGWSYCWFPFSFEYWSLPGIFVLLGLGLLIGWVLSRSRNQAPPPPPSEGASTDQDKTQKQTNESKSGEIPHRLFRSRDFRVIAGICGGLGKYFNLDPTIVRILWVIFGIASLGTSLLVYVILIFVIPEEPFA